MIKYKISDLLEDEEVNVLIHCTNLYNTFGSGIALAIKAKYPEAYVADCQTECGDKLKLGSYSAAKTSDGKVIYNLYAMKGLGTNVRQLDYEHFYSVLEGIKNTIEQFGAEDKNIIGISYKIGCDRAGGEFSVVKAMIESIFSQSKIKVVICVLPHFAKEAINLYNIQFESRNEYKSSIPFAGFPGNS